MARNIGNKNNDYAQKRERLLDLLFVQMMKHNFRSFPSFREVSDLLGVTPPTLRHYFTDREGLIKAFLEFIELRGKPFLDKAAVASGAVDYSVRELLHFIASGFEFGPVAAIHQFGLSNGLGDEDIGPAYLIHIFEPLLQSVEKRIITHQQQNELVEAEPRLLALSLLSPLFMVLIHQNKLGGKCVRPIDINSFIHQQADAFLKSYKVV
jgi:AcrR family transcriptional regulator